LSAAPTFTPPGVAAPGRVRVSISLRIESSWAEAGAALDNKKAHANRAVVRRAQA